jgi:large subunit ribosomal protein L25
MAKVVFAAKKRSGQGSGDAGRLRRAGRIPAVLYGRKGESLSLDLDEREFSNGVKGISESTIVQINVEGESHEAFVKDTQRSITTGSILHVDFYQVESGQLLRTNVSVHCKGNPIGVRNGGVLELPLHNVEVECLPADLPERIIVDISGLDVNQSIHVADLHLGEKVRLISSGDQVVALVKFAKEEAAPTAAEGEAADAAGPAAAEPAAEAGEGEKAEKKE